MSEERNFLDRGEIYTLAGTTPVYMCPFVKGLACEREPINICLTCTSLPPVDDIENFKEKFALYKRQLASHLLEEKLKRSKKDGNG